MAHDLFSFDSSVLLVRDVAGDYRPADAGEVLSSSQVVRDFGFDCQWCQLSTQNRANADRVTQQVW